MHPQAEIRLLTHMMLYTAFVPAFCDFTTETAYYNMVHEQATVCISILSLSSYNKGIIELCGNKQQYKIIIEMVATIRSSSFCACLRLTMSLQAEVQLSATSACTPTLQPNTESHDITTSAQLHQLARPGQSSQFYC